MNKSLCFVLRGYVKAQYKGQRIAEGLVSWGYRYTALYGAMRGSPHDESFRPSRRMPPKMTTRKPSSSKRTLDITHRPQSNSFLGLPYRILNMNLKKQLLWGLWVSPTNLTAWKSQTKGRTAGERTCIEAGARQPLGLFWQSGAGCCLVLSREWGNGSL